MLPQREFDILKGFFAREEEVSAGYLFGSFAKGTDSRSSDVDIAVLLTDAAGPDTDTDLAGRYVAGLSELLGREVDVVILNDAPPFLKFQIFRHGQSLFDRNPKRSGHFIAAALIEYFDFEPLKRSMEERIIQRLKEQPS